MNPILNVLKDLSFTFREWIIENQKNPLFWMGLFFLALLIFATVYNALQKEK